MMRRLVRILALLLLLPACHITPHEVPLPEVPAEPFVKVLAQRREAFTGMKAVARVETERNGRRRVYESVAILLQGYRKLKVEGYGPMGEPLFALLWDGSDVLVRRPGDTEPVKVGRFGLEGMLALPITPTDLCALLTGNVPAMPSDARARAGCGPDGHCQVDIRYDDVRWRVAFAPPSANESGDRAITGAELWRGERLVFESDFLRPEGASVSQVPQRIVIENPGQKVRLLVDYGEAEAGIQVEDSLFILGPGEDATR